MTATGQAPAASAPASAAPSLPGSGVQETAWALLPPNVLIRVFEQLSLQELCCCSHICTAWRSAAAEDRLWQRLLQEHFCRSTPTSNGQSCKQSVMQLKTGSLWSCGSAWPSLTASVGGAVASSRPTELVKLWSNLPTATVAPLKRYCRLPAGFAVAAAAAGRSCLVLLSSGGHVIDTRAAAATAADDDGRDAVQALADPAAIPAALAQHAYQAAEAAAGLQQDNALQAAADVELLQQQLGVLQLCNPWRPMGTTVTSVAAGAGHVLAVTCCGQVWGWGANTHGQLGLGHSNAWVAAPTEATAALEGAWKADGDMIVSAACGDLHSALLAASGAVYTAGCNRQGQCGQGPELSVCTVFCQPSYSDSVKEPIRAAAVACGTANAAIASRRGRLLVCGDATSGQCGPSHMKQRCCWQLTDTGPELGWHGLTRPTAAEVAAAGGEVAQALPKVVKVAAGCGTCYALTDDGDIYAWGAGSKGQLGRGGCAKVQATPAKLPWAKRVVQLSASLDGHFAAAVDATGHLYTWGAGKWGQLGHGDTSKRTVGRAVKQLKQSDVLQVVCGSESLLVLTSDRPLQHAANSTHTSSSSTGTHVGHTIKQQQQQSLLSLVSQATSQTTNSSTVAAAAAGDRSMDGAHWVDVEGQGPFYCPAPRTGRGHRGSNATRRHAAAAAAAAAVDLHVQPPGGSSYADGGTVAAADEMVDHRKLHRCSSSSSSSSSDSRPWQQQLNPRDRQHAAGAVEASSSAAAMMRSSYAGGCGRRVREGWRNKEEHDSWAPEGRRSRIAAAVAAGAAADAAAANRRSVAGHHDNPQQQQQQQEVEEVIKPDSHADGSTGDAAAEHLDCGPENSSSNSRSMVEAGGSDGALPARHRHPRIDKGFRRLLKRLLTNFAADSRQRELSFPANLSSVDRYYVHVAAEAWGLGHASHNEGDERVIKVWKVSRSRRAMRSGADPSFGSD